MFNAESGLREKSPYETRWKCRLKPYLKALLISSLFISLNSHADIHYVPAKEVYTQWNATTRIFITDEGCTLLDVDGVKLHRAYASHAGNGDTVWKEEGCWFNVGDSIGVIFSPNPEDVYTFSVSDFKIEVTL